MGVLLLLLSLLLVAATTRAEVFRSTGPPIQASPTSTCNSGVCSGISTNVNTPVGSAAISAAVYLPTSNSAKLRFQLNGTAHAGYRAGALLSADAASLGLNAFSSVTIRTYNSAISTTVAQETRVVSGSVLEAQLLAGNGDPAQLEFIAAADFDQVELEFNSVSKLGSTINAYYAYGAAPNPSTQVLGFTSNSSSATPGQAITSGCSGKVSNPTNAVDNDQTNYATFSSLATVACNSQLQVPLNGTAPSTYKAGFVIGKGNTLLDASVLGSLKLHTYLNGVEQETATGNSLLGLSVLPDSKSLVSFQATKQFDAVSIERTDAVAVLDNLRLYYGVGVASTTPPQILSSGFSDNKTHYTVTNNGVLCVLCSVSSPANAAGNPNDKATINVGVGVANWVNLTLDLNGAGAAGNRAGMVIGNSSLIDVAALSRMTLITYDNAGNVLETANGSSVLQANVLPDGRKTISFNTTMDFAKVGLQINGLVSALSNTDVYYAFTDNSNGSLSIVTPTGPLPVVLTSFSVRRLASMGTAEITWATATEQNSASFAVERSANPAEGFVAIGQVAAAGTSGERHTYTLRDGTATQTSVLYYRLRQVDTNGHVTLSAVAVLAAGPVQAGFTLYPNPAPATAQEVTLGASADLAAGYTISLYSGTGELLHSRMVGGDGSAAITIRTAGLAAGLYHVVLRDGMGRSVSSQRLVVAGH